jgi:hypothetical protein
LRIKEQETRLTLLVHDDDDDDDGGGGGGGGGDDDDDDDLYFFYVVDIPTPGAQTCQVAWSAWRLNFLRRRLNFWALNMELGSCHPHGA